MRGLPLQAKQARRLIRRADVHVVRAYGFKVAEVLGGERDALMTRIEEFLAGQAPPSATSSSGTSGTGIIG
jgi:hypothetical protein